MSQCYLGFGDCWVSGSDGLWVFGPKVARGLRTRFVPADEHHIDAADARLGLGDVATEVQGRAAGAAATLGFRVAGGHGSTVRQVWRGSQPALPAAAVRRIVVRSGDSGWILRHSA
ncbi:hypothetical protein GOTRE_026_01000 [Gordonia terrae NBRC 100016]|uniref:Uncharacterized protein n=1 Tax=Gordonia terrae NBRC 100016 TaxID=1089454 RepID=A0ABQ0HAC7_9ACTN|nr:hypothetical protein GOTRE_026_01000 [Gordonia terrae NBRC 100016]